MKLADRIAELERKVAQLQEIVAILVEQAQDSDDAPMTDLDGNIIPTFPPAGPHEGL